MDSNFYVYVYLDPRKKGNFKYGDYEFNYEPFYVGKGKGRRYKRHLNSSNYSNGKSHKNNKIKYLLDNGYKPKIKKIKSGITEEESFKLEKLLIFKIGRNDKNLGPLCNHTDGGEGSTGGIRHTKGKTLIEIHGLVKAEMIRKKLSESHKKNNEIIGPEFKKKRVNPNKGKTLEEIYGTDKANELKKIITKNLNFKKHSEESKKKISDSLKGKRGRNTGNKHSIETKKRISKAKKGEISWNAKKVLQLTKDDKLIKEWRSATFAAKKLKLSQGNIWLVINGDRKTCGGFKWKIKGNE